MSSIPPYDSLERWIDALWPRHPRKGATPPIPYHYALTCWRNHLTLRIVTLANGWHIVLEQVGADRYLAVAESSDAQAIYHWLCERYPVDAARGRWRPEPWPYWRNNVLPTRVGVVL